MNISTNISKDVYPFEIYGDCDTLQLIGYYFILLSIIGTVLNGLLLNILIRNEKLRKLSTNILLGGLLFADLIGAFFEIPLPALSLINCRWIWSNVGCRIEAIISYFVGCSNIYILCLISIDRYSAITKMYRPSAYTTEQSYAYIFMAYSLALFWSVMPLLGWSFYEFEGIGTSCSLNWGERSFNVISYNATIFIFVYFVPVMIMFIVNAKIYQSLRIRRYSTNSTLHRSFLRRRRKLDRRILGTIICVIGGFLIAWTPYAIMALIQIFYVNHHISPILITMPALFAKTSFVWNPLILILRDGNFRKYLPLVPNKHKNNNRHDRSQKNKETYVIQFFAYQDSISREV